MVHIDDDRNRSGGSSIFIQLASDHDHIALSERDLASVLVCLLCSEKIEILRLLQLSGRLECDLHLLTSRNTLQIDNTAAFGRTERSSELLIADLQIGNGLRQVIPDPDIQGGGIKWFIGIIPFTGKYFDFTSFVRFIRIYLKNRAIT